MPVAETALSRYRAIAETLRQVTATAADVQRRLHDAMRTRYALQIERERLTAPRYAGIGLGGRMILPDPSPVAEVDRQIEAAEGEITRLNAELERAEAKKSDASDLVGRCSAFLLDLGAERRQLEY